ncbi:hypothetical protein O6H91_01G176500 [Diphasiastrum complanatum]|uniref:Uncharacterized protein n=1 Tax=Diphasiastrum complanatum TaxID=34168 RepID=A0ACC2EZ05_DIPCM|nr:hypothetical protein O6H91_01G176500 [Diphasiastrum complanatum]
MKRVALHCPICATSASAVSPYPPDFILAWPLPERERHTHTHTHTHTQKRMERVALHCPICAAPTLTPPPRLCIYSFQSHSLLTLSMPVLPLGMRLFAYRVPLRSSTQPCFPNSSNVHISAAAAKIQAQLKTTSFTDSSFGSLTALQLLQKSIQLQAVEMPSIHRSSGKCSRGVRSELVHRRTLVGILPWLLPYPASFPPPAAADDFGDQLKLYKDEEQGWVKGEGKATGQRKVTAFFPAGDTNTNVNIVITNLGADFTGLGSFGPVDSFAETLVNGLDRSWQKPPGQSAILVNASSRNGLYYVDYTLQKPGERMRHLLSVVGIGVKGWYNQLFTVTGQFWEEELDQYKQILERVISSFQVI